MIGVSLVTNGRNGELLAFAVRRWAACGADIVCVVSSVEVLAALYARLAEESRNDRGNVGSDCQWVDHYWQRKENDFWTSVSNLPGGGFKASCGIEDRNDWFSETLLVPASVAPADLGKARQAGVAQLLEKNCTVILHSDDDVIPLTSVMPLEETPPDALQAVKLIGVTGGRWFDWAVHERGISREQPYDEKAPGTYVTLASQCVGAELAKQLDYGTCGGFRMKQDVRYSQKAAQLGRLLPPTGDVVLLHLDRK